MPESRLLFDPQTFSAVLYEKIKPINPAHRHPRTLRVSLCLGLHGASGRLGFRKIGFTQEIEHRINSSSFYSSIQIKRRVADRIVMDEAIIGLSQMLCVGLVTEEYSLEWVQKYFYFDIRGFYFLVRTVYFTPEVLDHLGGKPYKRFTQKQEQFTRFQDLGYQDFKKANAEVDQLFIESVKKLIALKQTPILIAIAGPTAAGKTEIVDRLRSMLVQSGQSVTSIEMDNFLTDRDFREEKGIRSEGKEGIHFDLFMSSLAEISRGHRISIPRYDFIFATSSHDLDGNLKPDGIPIEIEFGGCRFHRGQFPILAPGSCQDDWHQSGLPYG